MKRNTRKDSNATRARMQAWHVYPTDEARQVVEKMMEMRGTSRSQTIVDLIEFLGRSGVDGRVRLARFMKYKDKKRRDSEERVLTAEE